jgi:23S rRNA (pseudouridine1915-N3)-methyltransferase
MRLRFVWPGKTREPHLRALGEDYLKRLARFVRCEVTELRQTVSGEPRVGIGKDSQRISDALRSGTVTVLLDREGSEWTSEELAAQVQRWQSAGTKEVNFVVGGPYGVSPELSAAADKRWSLSRLTFTHEMARVLLLEQLYRAYAIVYGLPYQK